MNDSPREERHRIDVVVIRCGVALVLAALSLVLVIRGHELSLLPLVVGFGLITHGRDIKNRNAPPITFLLMLPIIVVIAVTILRR